MKIFKNRAVAWVVLVLAIVGSVCIGLSRKDSFLAKEPVALPEVEYQQWICDEADMLSDDTVAYITERNADWDAKYYAVVAVATADSIQGWTPEEAAIYPAEVDARPHPGGQRTLLCANIFEYWRSTMAERFEIVEKALLKMLDEKKYASLRDILVTMNPSDVAGLFDGLEEKQIPVMFRLLPKEQAAETFVEMEPEAQQLLIQGFSDNELREVLDELYVDDAADLVEEMPANVVRRILTQADPEMRSSINQILRYPENSAGALMTMEYVSLRLDMTVEESILRIRRQGVDKETIYTCYVLSADRTLQGIVTVKDLLLAESDDTEIKEIMTENVISVTTQDDQEEVAKMFSKYNFLALPVVDTEKRMVGIVTFDDAMDVMEEEATEDMEQKG